jgi:hypothetical protein
MRWDFEFIPSAKKIAEIHRAATLNVMSAPFGHGSESTLRGIATEP